MAKPQLTPAGQGQGSGLRVVEPHPLELMPNRIQENGLETREADRERQIKREKERENGKMIGIKREERN